MRDYFVEIIAKCLATFISNKGQKRRFRDKVKTFFYGHRILTKAKSIGKDFVCRDYSSITKDSVIIGDNVRIGSINHNGFGELKIGNYCEIGENVRIITQNHNYDKGTQIPYSRDAILKGVEIGDFVWIGSEVVILPGTKIEEGAVIQGGAVVHGTIPRCAIAGGNPAKVFKYRDIEHYEKLKEEGAFLDYYD